MSEALDTHLARYLGHGMPDRTVGGVEIWRHERPEFVSFATHGLSTQEIQALVPQELACSVRHGQDGAALELVSRTLDLILEHRRGVVDAQLIVNDRGPLLAGTRIVGVLISSHPYLDEEFDVLVGTEGAVEAELQSIIPVTDSEVSRANVDGVDGLVNILEITDPPLLDVTRA